MTIEEAETIVMRADDCDTELVVRALATLEAERIANRRAASTVMP